MLFQNIIDFFYFGWVGVNPFALLKLVISFGSFVRWLCEWRKQTFCRISRWTFNCYRTRAVFDTWLLKGYTTTAPRRKRTAARENGQDGRWFVLFSLLVSLRVARRFPQCSHVRLLIIINASCPQNSLCTDVPLLFAFDLHALFLSSQSAKRTRARRI